MTAKLADSLRKALAVPAVREKYAGMGVEVMDMAQPAFADYVRVDFEKWRQVARDASIVVE